MCTLAAFAQTDSLAGDSTSLPSLYNYHNARVQFHTVAEMQTWVEPDTTLDNFAMFNPARQDLFENAWLGNLGSPYTPRWFDYHRELGFDYGRHERDAYITTLDEVKYYRTNVPFTRLYYLAGQSEEQLFHVTHTRNFGPQGNVAIDFSKLVSTGYYQYSRNDYGNTTLSGWYTTKNNRYLIEGAAIRGKNNNEENGGINNDTLFNYPNPELAEPFRTQAFTEWSNWQGRITQSYQLGKNFSYQINDSTTGNYFDPKFVITHTLTGIDHYYLFEDPATDRTYYGTLLYESDTLRDRTSVRGFENKLQFATSLTHRVSVDSVIPAKLFAEIYALQQHHILSDQAGKQDYDHFIIGTHLLSPSVGKHGGRLGIDAAYDLINKNYDTKLIIQFDSINPESHIFVRYGLLNPTVIESHYSGFRDEWNGSGMPTVFSLGLNAESKPQHFTFHASFSMFKDYNYASTSTWFEEHYLHTNTLDFNIGQAYIRKKITLGNFVFDNVAGAQFAMDITSIPNFIYTGDWYVQGNLFKNALYSQAGIHFWGSSAYTPMKYDMITGRFLEFASYGTNNSSTFPPVIDLFASFDIRTFRFFVRMDNIAQGLFNKGYYEAPNYPMQPRSFKLGINWDLFY